MDTSPHGFSFTVLEAQSGKRLDIVLSEQLEECSRSYAAQLIQQGAILVNLKPCKAAYRVRIEDHITGHLPEAEPAEFLPEPIDLDIIYEDAALIVINKPAGLVVHPAPGHPSGTLVNGLLYHCPDLAAFRGEIRPGIVHRLDKDTSGVMVIAKTPTAHERLAAQFKNRIVRKSYLALVRGVVKNPRGKINLPIGRHPTARKQMSTVSARPRPAETHYRVRETFEAATLLELDLKTGRTHQIRVHCAALHHPVLGDGVYGGRHHATVCSGSEEVAAKTVLRIQRQMLHAWRLEFEHPVHGQRQLFEAPIPEDMQAAMDILGSC